MDRTIFQRHLFKNDDFRFRLRVLLSRTTGEKLSVSKQRIFDMHCKTDEEIVEELRQVCKKRTHTPEDKVRTYRGKAKQVLAKLGGCPDGINEYLDVGTGDGTVACAVARVTNANNVYACDLAEYGNVRSRINNFYLSHPNGKSLPKELESKTFDLVSTVQLLHHVQESQELLSEINQRIRPGGYLLIKEHNADTDLIRQLIIIEHVLFHKVLQNDNEWYTDVLQLRSVQEWDELIASCGFRKISSYFDGSEITNSFWALYQLPVTSATTL